MDELVEHVNSKHQNNASPPAATAEETGEGGKGGGTEKTQQQGENHVNGVASGVSCSALYQFVLLLLSFSNAHHFKSQSIVSHVCVPHSLCCYKSLPQHPHPGTSKCYLPAPGTPKPPM